MPSPLIQKPETATSAALNPLVSFLRFVVLGGGVGVLSGLAVPLLAMTLPWAVSNALVTAAATLLCTELHARFTFGTGRRAGWREHWQSAGSATAAYLVTTAAVYVLHLAQPAAGILSEQIVYLSASALAGLGRFALLRLYVFAVRRDHKAVRPPVTWQPGAVPPVLAVVGATRSESAGPSHSSKTACVVLFGPRCAAGVSTPGASAHGGGVTPAWDRGGLDERRVVAARLPA
ncbi:GtrA family protein [Streptomyces sviceus]|uniref:GtrA family protein n=1 Tax=Streptomyces sviceus TaxID=285530 RepID=UPI0037F11B51